MLEARERRARAQREALERFGLPVLTATPVTPGPGKDGPVPRALLVAALGALEERCRDLGWPFRAGSARYLPTGPEALLVVDAPALDLKRALVALEDVHPLGRLWDLDVLDPATGPVTRGRLGLPARTCLLCGEPAHACARSRAHRLEDLQGAIGERLHAGGLRIA